MKYQITAINTRINNSFCLEPIIIDDIKLQMKKLKYNKSPGYDPIESKLTKPCSWNIRHESKLYIWGKRITSMIWKLQK